MKSICSAHQTPDKDCELCKIGIEDEVRVDALVRSQHHTKCHDCGQFLSKDKWVSRTHQWKKHALCAECLSGYDDLEY